METHLNHILDYIWSRQDHLGTYFLRFVDRNFWMCSIVIFFLAYWCSNTNFWITFIKIFFISPVSILPVLYFSPIYSNSLSSSKKNLKYW